MAVSQHIASGEWRQIIGAVQMSVSEKQAGSLAQNLLPGGGYGEMEQHLIDFAVAVAANGNHPLRYAV